MGYRVTKRRNKDGSTTRTTTFTSTTLFGNRKVETRTERIPSRKQRRQIKAQKKAARSSGLPWWIWPIGILILYAIFSKQ